MSEIIRLTTPLTDKVIEKLKIGVQVLITGTLYTARDAAHKRLVDLLNNGKELPFDIRGQIIYYVGPAPARPGYVTGPAGPTTSGRMDPYAPRLMEAGDFQVIVVNDIHGNDLYEEGMKKYRR